VDSSLGIRGRVRALDSGAATSEPLGVLLLPTALERFELQDHARGLLQIARVLALEPSRFRTPRFLRDAAPLRQARRLKLPGRPRLVVLYHPAQYRLARALRGRYDEAELWYFRPARDALQAGAPSESDELLELDALAYERAVRTVLTVELDAGTDELRARMRELEIISPRPFIPSGRISRS
jgi:hypothetical protein